MIAIELGTHMDWSKTGPVSRSHILIYRFHSISPWHFPTLLVHVVCSRSRVVSKPYSKVLHSLRTFLRDLPIPSVVQAIQSKSFIPDSRRRFRHWLSWFFEVYQGNTRTVTLQRLHWEQTAACERALELDLHHSAGVCQWPGIRLISLYNKVNSPSSTKPQKS